MSSRRSASKSSKSSTTRGHYTSYSNDGYLPPALEALDTYKEVVVGDASDHPRNKALAATTNAYQHVKPRMVEVTKPVDPARQTNEIDPSAISSNDELYLRRLKAKSRNKAASVLGIVTLKEPSGQAWREYAEQQQKATLQKKPKERTRQHGHGDSISSVQSTAKPEKTSSRWAGLRGATKWSSSKSSNDRTPSTPRSDPVPVKASHKRPQEGNYKSSVPPQRPSRSNSRQEFITQEPSTDLSTLAADIRALSAPIPLDSEIDLRPSTSGTSGTTFLDPPTPTLESSFEPSRLPGINIARIASSADSTGTSSEGSPRTPPLDDAVVRFIHSLDDTTRQKTDRPVANPLRARHATSNKDVDTSHDVSSLPHTPSRQTPSRSTRHKPTIGEPTILEDGEYMSPDYSASRTGAATPSIDSQPSVIRNFSYIRKYHSRSESSSSRPQSRQSATSDTPGQCTPQFSTADLCLTPELEAYEPQVRSRSSTTPTPATQRSEALTGYDHPAVKHAATASDISMYRTQPSVRQHRSASGSTAQYSLLPQQQRAYTVALERRDMVTPRQYVKSDILQPRTSSAAPSHKYATSTAWESAPSVSSRSSTSSRSKTPSQIHPHLTAASLVGLQVSSHRRSSRSKTPSQTLRSEIATAELDARRSSRLGQALARK